MRYGFEAFGTGNSLYEQKLANGTGRYVLRQNRSKSLANTQGRAASYIEFTQMAE